jgi:hypothetical protein
VSGANLLDEKSMLLAMRPISATYGIRWKGLRGFQLGNVGKDQNVFRWVISPKSRSVTLEVGTDPKGTGKLKQSDVDQIVETLGPSQDTTPQANNNP